MWSGPIEERSPQALKPLSDRLGLAQSDINEEGQVFVAGEIWTAVNQTGRLIKKGEKIKVLGIDKTKLLVGN